MWNTKENIREEKIIAFADGGYGETVRQEERGKLSGVKAMILGFLATVEIMVAAAMIFNFDFMGADYIALIFAFMVLYAGVVAVLTDK